MRHSGQLSLRLVTRPDGAPQPLPMQRAKSRWNANTAVTATWNSNWPEGVFWDRWRVFVVMDTVDNHIQRRVATVMHAPCHTDDVNWPHAVVMDGNGDYVISDTFKHRIGRCDAGAPSLYCLFTPSECSANAENKSVHRTRPCAPSPPVSTPISHRLNDWALFMHLSLPLFGQGNTPIVAPLHACRRGFAAFVFAFMVCLPQTASGVPAAGIDPTAEELQHIGDVTGIFSWLGLEEPLRTALIRVLGGCQSRLRDLVYVLADLWRATVRDFRNGAAHRASTPGPH